VKQRQKELADRKREAMEVIEREPVLIVPGEMTFLAHALVVPSSDPEDRMRCATTVQSWLAAGTFPERKPREQGCQLDRYLSYLRRRWQEGCHNMAHLFRELTEQGYQGSYESVRDTLVRLLPIGRKNQASCESVTPALPTSRQAAFLLLHRPEKLCIEEQEQLSKLRLIHPEVDLAYDLVQQFARMLRTRTGAQCLDPWLDQVEHSNLPELQSFVTGVKKDKDAVRAGLTWQINNGMVEGHVTKYRRTQVSSVLML